MPSDSCCRSTSSFVPTTSSKSRPRPDTVERWAYGCAYRCCSDLNNLKAHTSLVCIDLCEHLRKIGLRVHCHQGLGTFSATVDDLVHGWPPRMCHLSLNFCVPRSVNLDLARPVIARLTPLSGVPYFNHLCGFELPPVKFLTILIAVIVLPRLGGGGLETIG